MPFVFKRLALFISIAAAFAADKEAPFRAAPAASYTHKQTNGQVTIAAEPYMTEEQLKSAFGKLRPPAYGILPVLVVIQNDSDKAVRFDRMKVQFVGANRSVVDATPAREVRYARPPQRPGILNGPAGPVAARSKKNPLDAWEIEGRAFAAQILAAGQSASGFFYFQTQPQANATVLLNGLYEAGTGQELLFFEIPVR
jgi:hypothetical protein